MVENPPPSETQEQPIDNQDTIKLQSYLRSVEEKYDVTVVAAWVGGSYAWGLESPTSDYDISFIYRQNLTDYAIVSGYDDSLDFSGQYVSPGVPPQFHLDNLEFNGWDIRYFGELLLETNPTPIEILVGGIPIKTHYVVPELRDYVCTRFHNIELYQHYRSLAANHYGKYIQDSKDISTKRALYMLRGALSAEYIRYKHLFPPLKFSRLLEDHPDSIPENIVQAGRDIAERKRSGDYNPVSEDVLDTIRPFVTDVIERKVGSEKFNHEQHIPEKTIDASDIDDFILRILTNQQ